MQSYQQFTLSERISLAQKLQEGKNNSQIARELGRHRSTIGRELQRNWSKTKNRYHPWRATILYISRRKRCVRKPRLADETARKFVISGLNKFWSPEIISERWKMEHPEKTLAPGTIYRSVKKKMLPEISSKTHLRRRGKRKNKHNTKAVQPEYTIHERPSIIEERVRLGDLEGDTVYGGIGKGCMVTLVDRVSRFLYASLAGSRETTVINQAFQKALGVAEVSSITLDNGSEFADFAQIKKNHNTTVYFADPHSPWQRGTNENINGLVRFFYPKGTDFHAVPPEELDNVLSLINNRPRKCLGWLSPIEFISKKCCT